MKTIITILMALDRNLQMLFVAFHFPPRDPVARTLRLALPLRDYQQEIVLHIDVSLLLLWPTLVQTTSKKYQHLDLSAELQPNLQLQLVPPPERPPSYYNKRYPLLAHLRNPSAERLARQGEKVAAKAANARA